MTDARHRLRVSIAGNVCLALALILAVRRNSEPRLPPRGAEARPVVAESKPIPFHWGQLESEDYRTYIANLRGVGCPETTIRDIIVADVHALYEPRYRGLATETAGSAAVAAAERHLARQRVEHEEAALLEVLLGSPSHRPPVQLSQSDVLPRRTVGERPVTIPLAFQEVGAAAMALSPAQTAILEELREKFRADLGGATMDPNAPDYRQRWETAQRENDDLLAGLLGGQFYLDYQMQASPPQAR